MKIVKENIKNVLNSNFIFMSIVALLLGMLVFVGGDTGFQISNYDYKSLVLKGYVLIFIFFAIELSKSLLQKEKISGKLEWFIANGVSFGRICTWQSFSLFIATSILLGPLLICASFYVKAFSFLDMLDYFILTFFCSILINESILLIKNMNNFRTLNLYIPIFYTIILIGEVIVSLLTESIYISLAVRYLILCAAVLILERFISNERITSAYF